MNCSLLTLLVIGVSLAPAIPDHTRLQALPLACTAPPQKGDLVYFDSGAVAGMPVIKRIVAAPGDTFVVTASGTLVVNGMTATNSQHQSYRFAPARARMLNLYADSYNGHIPPESYLVLGENPQGTLDSSVYGLISTDQIIGKVIGTIPADEP